MGKCTRRQFVATVPGIGVVAAVGGIPTLASQSDPLPAGSNPIWPSFPHQNPEWVREMVGVCHRDIDRARELLDEHPALVNATWDWGFGDWETALGAASHTGRRNIAELLLERGARLDIFAAASLGQTETVKAMIAAAPGIQRSHGPHGLTLMHHARAGGDQAKDTVAFLEQLGDADPQPKTEPFTEEQKQAYIGRYGSPALGDSVVEISVRKSDLSLLVNGQTMRHLGNQTFFPAGAPAVRIEFAGSGSAMETVKIIDHAPLIVATRLS